MEFSSKKKGGGGPTTSREQFVLQIKENLLKKKGGGGPDPLDLPLACQRTTPDNTTCEASL